MNGTGETNRQQSGKTSRRRFLRLTGAGIGLALGGCLSGTGGYAWRRKILERGDRIDVGSKGDEIIENAYRLGYDYEKSRRGCAQCTVAALQDAIPFVALDKGLFRGASCLDGGATPTGIHNCGGFTGSGMIIGYVCGRTRARTFKGSAKLSRELIRKVYERFEEEYGSVLCKDVKKAANRNCPEVVAKAAKWTAEVLLKEFTNYA